MTNILQDRERAFEFEFFRKVDEELLARLRKNLELERRCDSISHHTGIKDVVVLRELAELGLDERTVMAMKLFPLVQVAWADGIVDKPERDEVLKAAELACGGSDTPAYKLLDAWLEEPPSVELSNAWRDYVIEVIDQLSLSAASALRTELLHSARKVASAAGGFFGLHSISQEEHKVLKELEFFLTEPYPPNV